MTGEKDMPEKAAPLRRKLADIFGWITGNALRRALAITAVYIVFGCLWIFESDSIADLLAPDRADLMLLSTLKGLIYVALTAGLIFGLTYLAFRGLIKARNTLAESERSKSVLLGNLPGMAYRCLYDRAWTMKYLSGGCLELTGYPPESLIDNEMISFNALILPEYQDELWNKWTLALGQRTGFTAEYEIVTAAGDRKWVWEQGRGIYDADGNVTAIEGLIIDVTTRKEQEFRLAYLSRRNELTGLNNRRTCEEILTTSSSRKRALLLINLKSFVLVNNAYGYQYGEMLAGEVAKKLSERFPDDDLFHISVDRFALIVPDYTDQDALFRVAEAIEEELAETLSPKNVKCCIGIVEISDQAVDADTLLKHAAIAAECESQVQEKSICIFNSDMEERIRRREIIINELKACARSDDEGRLHLEYQPIINSSTGLIRGYEALARFKSAAYGPISPLEFIPVAEETQLIVPLGKKILRLAFLFLRKLLDEGYGSIAMSVNVSAIQLIRDDFIEDLTNAVRETGVSPENITLEITESYFSENLLEINEKLGMIKRLGIGVAMDDFGMGYSSLARERELNIDCLKIDKYFVEKILELGEKETITSDIISMAHRLGHYVVAEGVEEEIQRRYLLEHQCDYLQGYYFSKPVAPEAALQQLSVNQNREQSSSPATENSPIQAGIYEDVPL